MSTYDPNYVPVKHYALIGQKAIVLNSENKILMLQRSEKSGAGGKWSLPGGAMEHGEEPFTAIAREIEEETQLTVSNIKPFHVKSSVHEGDFVVIIGYSCKANSDQVQLNWEHDNYKWLDRESALQLDLTGDGRIFLEHFNL